MRLFCEEVIALLSTAVVYDLDGIGSHSLCCNKALKRIKGNLVLDDGKKEFNEQRKRGRKALSTCRKPFG